MGFLIPREEISVDEIKALKEEVVANLLKRAVAQTGRPVTDFIVRDIFPKDDFDFNGCEWQNQSQLNSADTWEIDWYKELPDSKFVAFFGIQDHVMQAVPGSGVAEGGPFFGVSYRVGTNGATTREQIHLQNMQRWSYLTSGRGKNPVGFHKPVYYDGKETISAYLIGNAGVAQYAEQLELLGMVCEPIGNVISSVDKDTNPEGHSLGVPEDELTLADIKALRDETKTKLLDLYVKETGKARESAVVRDIFPKDDLSFNGVEWQNQTAISAADTWTEDWSKELPKTKFIGFYGIDYKKAASTPAAWKYMGVRYAVGSSGASTRKQIHIQKALKENITSVGCLRSARCFHRPVLYKGTETAYVSLIANTTISQYYDQLELLGLCVEPYGAVISG